VARTPQAASGVMRDPLPRSVFERDTVDVARSLLGCTLVRRTATHVLEGIIVETEAYLGERDLGCHSARGRTPRTEPMYGPPGRAYVYLIYGMYHCLNAVTRGEGEPEAVLVRAVRPKRGEKQMSANRVTRSGRTPDGVALTNGPGKLCQAFEIDLSLNNADLCKSENPLIITGGHQPPDEKIRTGPRVGIDYAGEWAAKPLRFWVDGDRYVSR